MKTFSSLVVAFFLFVAAGCTHSGSSHTDPIQIALIGPPGSGKGTQARLLVEKIKAKHISIGALLRAEVAAKTELGQRVQGIMARGELVDDATILELLKKQVSGLSRETNLILDGYPRTLSQAQSLETLMRDLNRGAYKVLELQVPDEEILRRLLKRGRADDNEKTIRQRIAEYRSRSEEIRSFYAQKEVLIAIDGNQTIEKVNQDIRKIVSTSSSEKK